MVMSPDERILMRAVNLMVITWQFREERATLLGLVEDALPRIPADGMVSPLIEPARAMVAAQTANQWTRAVTDAASALSKILRSDLAAAITLQVAKSMRVA